MEIFGEPYSFEPEGVFEPRGTQLVHAEIAGEGAGAAFGR